MVVDVDADEEEAPSPPYSPSVAAVDGGRSIAYDAIALTVFPEPDGDDGGAAARATPPPDDVVDVDVLLLHGMSPAGRRCWNFADRGGGGGARDARRRLAEAARSEAGDGGGRVGALRLIMPDRPGYGDSDAACDGIGDDGGGAGAAAALAAGYSYRRFAADMARLLEHARDGGSGAGGGGARRRRRRRHLIVLGTSSGGPCALAVRDRLLRDRDAGDLLREYYDGGAMGTIVCSSDGPYAHPDCPPEINEEDRKSLAGRSTEEYLREESRRPFRTKSWRGWITDYTLERRDWGFELGRDEDGVAAAAGSSAGERAGFCSPTVHVYTGGPRDFAASRMCGPFLTELIGDDAAFEAMEGQDHFYASRRPAVLAGMVTKLVDAALRAG